LRRARLLTAALTLGCALLVGAAPAAAAPATGSATTGAATGSATTRAAATASAATGAATASATAMPFAGAAVDAEQIALADASGALQVYDVVQVANPQAQPLSELDLPLLPGAQGVQVQSGGDAAGAKVQGDTLLLPVSLAPQAHATVSFSYVLPASRLPLNLVRDVAFPTAQLVVLMRADQLTLQTSSLAAMGTTQINGLPVRQFGAAAIPPGTVLAFTVAPAPGLLSQAAAAFTPTVWLVIASVALAGLLVLGMRRDSALTAEPGGER
jgi:hypothetical protein